MMMQTPEVQQQSRGHEYGGKVLDDDGGGDDIATPSTVAASPVLTPPSSLLSCPDDEEAPPSSASPPSRPQQPTGMSGGTGSSSTAMTIIHQAYGPAADLYRDVLRVRPVATDREIRTAYFRRGRQVLKEPDGDRDGVPEREGEGGVGAAAEEHGGGAAASAGPMSMAAVSQRSKLQFQAVSAAFDILSDPELRRQYDASGTIESMTLLLDQDDTTNDGAEVQVANAPHATSAAVVTGTSLKTSLAGRYTGLHRRNRSKTLDCNSSAGSSKRGIRWSNSVEELVIENDCASIASRRSWKCGGSLDDVEDGDAGGGGTTSTTNGNDGDDNNSVKSIENAAAGGVKETLRRLDERAKSFTRKEFLEELETSVTTLLGAASRTIAEASAAASAAAAAATTTEAADKSTNKDVDALATGGSTEPPVKDSVSRRLSFDNADENQQQNEGENKTGSSPSDYTTSGPKDAAANADANPKAAADAEEDPAADFYIFLSTYICGVVQELKGSLDQMGSCCGGGELPNPSSCFILDAELDGLVHMLRTEVDQHIEETDHHPFDEDPGGESPLGKTIETFDTESIASTIATERNAPAGN